MLGLEELIDLGLEGVELLGRDLDELLQLLVGVHEGGEGGGGGGGRAEGGGALA